MEISSLDALDPYLALAAAQAARQPPFPTSVPTEVSQAMATASVTATTAIPTEAAFGSLLQQASTVATPVSQAIDPAAPPALIQPVDQTQSVAALGTALDNANAGSTLLADPFATLLQQAYLSPLASHLATNQVQDTSVVADEMAKRDVSATTAVAASQAFGSGQSSNPNDYYAILETIQTQAATSNGGAESYLLVQRLMNAEGVVGSLDLLA